MHLIYQRLVARCLLQTHLQTHHPKHLSLLDSLFSDRRVQSILSVYKLDGDLGEMEESMALLLRSML